MRRTLHIAKMHGLGNSYIYINVFMEKLLEAELPTLALQLSDVHTGVGADGMILIGPSEAADFRMRIFNRDGSEGKNCGNGVRCVAKYVYEKGMTQNTTFSIETLGGIVHATVHTEIDTLIHYVTVDMGEPQLHKKDIPMVGDPFSITVCEAIIINDKSYTITAVSMGNPHVVLFVDDVHKTHLEEIGPIIEMDSLFPERTNVEIVHIKSNQEVDFRVWERGSGMTQACGTGACAAVVAGVLDGQINKDERVTVHLPGGDLEIYWSSDNNHIYIRGPAEFIFEGEYQIA